MKYLGSFGSDERKTAGSIQSLLASSFCDQRCKWERQLGKTKQKNEDHHTSICATISQGRRGTENIFCGLSKSGRKVDPSQTDAADAPVFRKQELVRIGKNYLESERSSRGTAVCGRKSWLLQSSSNVEYVARPPFPGTQDFLTSSSSPLEGEWQSCEHNAYVTNMWNIEYHRAIQLSGKFDEHVWKWRQILELSCRNLRTCRRWRDSEIWESRKRPNFMEIPDLPAVQKRCPVIIRLPYKVLCLLLTTTKK